MRQTQKNCGTLWPIDAVGVMICLLAATLIYLLAIAPLIRRNAQYMAQQQHLEQQRSESAKLIVLLADLRSQIEKVHRQLQAVPLRLESASTINKRLARLTDLAHECKLKINRIEPGNMVRGARYGTVPIILTGTGTYRSCTHFIHKLHERFGDTGIKSFDLTGSPGSSSPAVRCEFRLAWHTAPSEHHAGKAVGFLTASAQ